MDKITDNLFNKKKAISINDIAKFAGVSKSTVSRILNDKGKFSEDTRNKVLRVVKKLNYSPSMVARSLRNRRTKAVGLLLPDIVNPFFPEIVITIDNEKAAYDATTYCLELGHKRIGFIAAPLKVKIFARRLEGYRKALQRYGIEFDESLVVEGDSTIKSGGRAGKELLVRKDPPMAIFASNDSMAIGAMKKIQGDGLRIPEDISIIGFDDIPTASLVTPALTTIAQPKYEMGAEAMNLLIRMIEKKGASKSKVVLDTQLVVRESTKRLI